MRKGHPLFHTLDVRVFCDIGNSFVAPNGNVFEGCNLSQQSDVANVVLITILAVILIVVRWRFLVMTVFGKDLVGFLNNNTWLPSR